MKLFVELCTSKDKNSTYHALKVDFGYRVAVLTLDVSIISELADLKITDLYKMKVGEKKYIGSFNLGV